LLEPRPPQLADVELASVALGRRTFAVLLGVAFAVSAALCVYASQSADPLIGFRTAVQVSGWLCILAVFVGFCARSARNRRDLAEVTAAATGFFTGAAMLYLAHFQWSELPTAPAAPLAVKTAPGIWNPAQHLALPKSPLTTSAAAGGTAPDASRVARQRPAEVMVTAVPVPVAGVPLAEVTVTKEDPCAEQTGLSRLFCEERTRLENCRTRSDDDPACPSAIPASPPR
jgi:hypothetical protein